MRAVTKKLAHKLREAQARRRNSRFPFRALGQRFLHDLVALTSRVGWDSVDLPIYSCWNRVMEQLWPYYGTDTYEGRLLIDLTNFAPVCQILIAAIDTAVKIVSADEDKREELLREWLQQLQAERDRQMAFSEEILQDPTRLWVEIGDETQQLKILTRLKHSVENFGGVLTARELDVMTAVFNAVVRHSGLVVVEVPEWFSTSEMEWEHAQVSRLKGGGEEQCLRAVSIWGELNHPNIRKFFGACHVGDPLIIHEKTLPIACRGFSWSHALDVACGLVYLHGRGLVHTTLSASNILWSARQHLDGKAVLSGINLVRIEDSSKHQLVTRCAQLISNAGPIPFPTVLAQEVFRSYVEAVPAFNLVWLIFSTIRYGVVTCWRDQVSKRSARQGRCIPPCVSSDIQAFGFAIAEMMRTRSDIPFRARRQLSRYLRSRKLDIPPKRLAEHEWNLLVGMCAKDPAERLPILHVVETIAGLANVSGSSEANAVFTNIDVYTFNGQSITDMLQDAGALCEQLEESRCVHQPVLDRLIDIYKQLQNTVVKQLEVEDLVLILSGFIRLLDDEEACSSQTASEGEESRTIAGKNYSIHHHIDRFMARASLDNTAAVHRWRPEAQTPMRELADHELPIWFIPVHQIELARHIANGSFGAVYEGAWLGSKVVVKQVLTDQTDAENRKQFQSEADLWFSLNHDHIIKLYGACHEERPFFVCERATHGTLTSFVKGKERLEIWRYIHQASLGLRHLHDHGIVHGDLKGNNILVCDDGVKLADFGLSFIVNRLDTAAASNGALGAYRWKAPECLSGGSPTFASDIYSFGVCIVEALTGQVPWGNSMPEQAVRYNVTELKQFIPRPETLNEEEWGLVLRMCCFDASKRISTAAVVNYVEELFQARRFLARWSDILTATTCANGASLNVFLPLSSPKIVVRRRPKV